MRQFVCFAVVLLAASLSVAQESEPTARNPLQAPYFAIDPESPEVLGGRLQSGHVLLPIGEDPNTPEIVVPRQNLGLLFDEDQLDALAIGHTNVTPDTTFLLLFSVDRFSVGSAQPDPTMVTLGFPFNVYDQASIAQAASDAFLSLLLFDPAGPIPPPPDKGLTTSVSNNNTLAINGGDAGGVDFRVSPDQLSPADPNSIDDSQSDVDAGTGARPGGGKLQPPPWLMFSVVTGSPSLDTLPGTGSGADVYLDTDLTQTGGEVLYTSPEMLGLVPADDIDALLIFESGDYVFEPGQDLVIFSLAPGSPTLELFGFGPADLLASDGTGAPNLYAPADTLGLAPTDNLNMLDMLPCEDVLTCVTAWAIGYTPACNTDLDGDEDVDLADLAILLAAYDTCDGEPDYNPAADFDGSGCIDLADLSLLLSQYGCGTG